MSLPRGVFIILTSGCTGCFLQAWPLQSLLQAAEAAAAAVREAEEAAAYAAQLCAAAEELEATG